MSSEFLMLGPPLQHVPSRFAAASRSAPPSGYPPPSRAPAVRWAPPGPRHGALDTPTVRLVTHFLRVRPPDTHPDTVSADQSSCGHPPVAGRTTDRADLATVRSAGHPPFAVTAQPMALDPVRTATAKRRTPPAPSVRPCARPAGHRQPRGLDVLALTGHNGNGHARLRPTPAATSTGTRPS